MPQLQRVAAVPEPASRMRESGEAEKKRMQSRHLLVFAVVEARGLAVGRLRLSQLIIRVSLQLMLNPRLWSVDSIRKLS